MLMHGSSSHTRKRYSASSVFQSCCKEVQIKWLANKDCMQIIIYVHLDILTVLNLF